VPGIGRRRRPGVPGSAKGAARGRIQWKRQALGRRQARRLLTRKRGTTNASTASDPGAADRLALPAPADRARRYRGDPCGHLPASVQRETTASRDGCGWQATAGLNGEAAAAFHPGPPTPARTVSRRRSLIVPRGGVVSRSRCESHARCLSCRTRRSMLGQAAAAPPPACGRTQVRSIIRQECPEPADRYHEQQAARGGRPPRYVRSQKLAIDFQK